MCACLLSRFCAWPCIGEVLWRTGLFWLLLGSIRMPERHTTGVLSGVLGNISNLNGAPLEEVLYLMYIRSCCSECPSPVNLYWLPLASRLKNGLDLGMLRDLEPGKLSSLSVHHAHRLHPTSTFKPYASAIWTMFTSEDDLDGDDPSLLLTLFPLLGRPFYTICLVSTHWASKTLQSVPGKAKSFFLSSFPSQIVYFLLCIPAVANSRNILWLQLIFVSLSAH